MFRLCNPNKLGNNIYIYIRKHNLTNISIPIEPTTLGIIKWRNTRSAYWIYRAQATTNRTDIENSQYIITIVIKCKILNKLIFSYENRQFNCFISFLLLTLCSCTIYLIYVPYIWYIIRLSVVYLISSTYSLKLNQSFDFPI